MSATTGPPSSAGARRNRVRSPSVTRGPGRVEQQEQQRQPRRHVQLVDVFYLGAQESPQSERGRGQEAAEGRQTQRPASEGIREGGCQEDVQRDGRADEPRRRQPGQRDIDGVQHRGLDVAQEGRAHEQVRIPQRQVAATQPLRCVLTVGVEVREHVQPDQDQVGQDELPEEDHGQSQQADDGRDVATDGVRHGAASSMRYSVNEALPSSRYVS